MLHPDTLYVLTNKDKVLTLGDEAYYYDVTGNGTISPIPKALFDLLQSSDLLKPTTYRLAFTQELLDSLHFHNCEGTRLLSILRDPYRHTRSIALSPTERLYLKAAFLGQRTGTFIAYNGAETIKFSLSNGNIVSATFAHEARVLDTPLRNFPPAYAVMTETDVNPLEVCSL